MATIGPYKIIRRVGAGGMAEVYLAEAFGASGFSKRIALKVLLPELRANAKLQRLLIEEAKLAANLQHRNLVGVHDLGSDNGIYYVRMDYVDGADLRSLGTPPLRLALLIAIEVSLALQYLHQAGDRAGRPLGLVHRDVSPSNILLSRSGEVKLADFGVLKATMLADVTRAHELKGKYAYMSPEQAAGQQLTARSDQFSLGVTLMELCCGHRPFDGQTPLETLELIQAAEPPGLDELSADPALQQLIWRCLQRQPDRRFADDLALQQALDACRRQHPASPADLALWVAETAGGTDHGTAASDRQSSKA